MYSIGVPSLIKKLDDFFHFFGVWQDNGTPVVRKIGGYLLFLTCLGFTIAILSRAVETNSKDESLFLVATSIYAVVIMVRNNNIRHKRQTIMTLLHENCSHSFANESDFIEVNKKINKFLNLAVLFIIMIAIPVPVVSLCVLPAFSKEKALPFKIGYNVNWKDNNFAYLVAYVYCAIAVLYILATTYINVLIWYLMIGFSIQYDNLGFRLRDMDVAKTTSNTKVVTEKQSLFHRDLMDIIRHHKIIHKNVNEFKSLFSYIFFVQIMTSGICICGSIYTIIIASRETQLKLVDYSIQMLYGIFDIFMLMYLANDIKLSSNRLSYYIFESNWIQQPKSTKKCLIILTENLKQPHELMIYKLYPLNMQTFTSILRVAYSTFNILRNI